MSDLGATIEAILGGSADAWPRLQAAIAPLIANMARGNDGLRARNLHTSPDELSAVQLAVFERLSQDDFRNLRSYCEQLEARGPSAQSFESWLYGAVDYAIRDHLRARYGRAPSAETLALVGDGPSTNPSKRAVNTLADRFDAGDHDRSLVHTLGMTAKLTAEAIFEHIDAQFTVHEATALRLYYLEDRSFEEIASALELAGPKDADKLIRRLNARLRYTFAERESTP